MEKWVGTQSLNLYSYLYTLYTSIWLYIFLPDMYLFIKYTYSFLSKVAETLIKECESTSVS